MVIVFAHYSLAHSSPSCSCVFCVCVWGGVLCRQLQKSCVHVYIGHLISRRQHVTLPPPSFGSYHFFSLFLWCSWSLEEAGRAREGWSCALQLSCLSRQSPVPSSLTSYEPLHQLSLTAKKKKV